MRLIARLRAFLDPVDHLYPPLADRVTELERRIIPLEEASQAETEREIRWAELNAQLRRYLGRLDAHAGRARQEEGENGSRATLRPDVIAAKFPHGLPTKE